MRGYNHVKFYVSGGIKEEDVPVLNPVVDGYGIGTSISNAPVVDFAMDIMEVEGRPLAKRGKWSGSKRVLECAKCGKRKIVPNRKGQYACECRGKFRDIIVPLLDKGRQLVGKEPAARLRKKVMENVKELSIE